MNKDCSVTPLQATDICYQKSYALLQKIRKTKNYCIPNDECALSFNNLNPAAAPETFNDAVAYTEVIYNDSVTVYCNNASHEDLSVFTQATGAAFEDTSANNFTVPAATFSAAVTLYNADQATITTEIANAKASLNLLAKNLAVMSLSCIAMNDSISVSCPSDPQLVNPQLSVDISSNIVGCTLNISSLDVLQNDLSNVPDYLAYIKANKTDEEMIQLSSAYKVYANKMIRDTAYMQLNCGYGNTETTSTCPAEAIDSGGGVHTPAEGSVASYTVLADSFVEQTIGSIIVNNTVANDSNNPFFNAIADSNDPYAITDGINNFITLYTNTNLNTYTLLILDAYLSDALTRKELVAVEAENFGSTNLQCVYGNLAQTFECDATKKYFNDIAAATYPTFNSGYYGEEISQPDAADSSKINVTINKVTTQIVNADTFTAIANFENNASITQRQAAANAAADAANMLAYENAAMSMSKCGYYNHRMYLYCDKGNSDGSAIAGTNITAYKAYNAKLDVNGNPIADEDMVPPYDEITKAGPFEATNANIQAIDAAANHINYIYFMYKNNYEVNSIIRTAYTDLSIAESYINFGTFNSLNNPNLTQEAVDALALNYLQLTTSCQYGNAALGTLTCDTVVPRRCDHGTSSEFGGDAIDINNYFANSPTEADSIATAVQAASLTCVCSDWTGGGPSININNSESVNHTCSDCQNNCTVFTQ